MDPVTSELLPKQYMTRRRARAAAKRIEEMNQIMRNAYPLISVVNATAIKSGSRFGSWQVRVSYSS